jgi:hypothetical protein
MNREEIIRMAREAGLPYIYQTGEVANLRLVERFATLVAAAERNKLAAWMIERGYATGHGDTVEDLLKELEWQIEESVRNEREACAKVLFDYAERDDLSDSDESLLKHLFELIRVRGQA